MYINTGDKLYSEIYTASSDLDSLNQLKQIYIEEAAIKDEIIAFGPKEHLKKLQEDLRKRGYKKMR